MTLFEMCQDVAGEVSLVMPQGIVGNVTDADAMLLLRLAKKEGYLLSQRHHWQVLRREFTFETVGDFKQPGSIPGDCDRIIPETIYNMTALREVPGPINPQEWAMLLVEHLMHIEPGYRIVANEFWLGPLPYTGETLRYEYMSKNWARSVGGDERSTFVADDDTTVLNEDCFIQGMIWRWRAHKGLEHETARLEYERMVTDRIFNDGTKPRIALGQVVTGTIKMGAR